VTLKYRLPRQRQSWTGKKVALFFFERYFRLRSAKRKDDAMMMLETDIHDLARQLLEAHGDKAIAEAAQRAVTFEKKGNREQAETWRHIEEALKMMRGPHES
jgi:hypothetical protein